VSEKEQTRYRALPWPSQTSTLRMLPLFKNKDVLVMQEKVAC